MEGMEAMEGMDEAAHTALRQQTALNLHVQEGVGMMPSGNDE